MEYNASRVLDKKLKLSPRNSIPHAFTPSEFYNRFLHVLDSHNLGKNEIETMNTRQIYYTIIEQRRSQRLIPFVPFSITNMRKQIQNDILPNYLKTFNCKIIWNLMPVKSKPYVATYHGTSLCSFCNQQDETESHLFFFPFFKVTKCVELFYVFDV